MIFHCVYVPQLLYPFICQWISRLLPCSSHCTQCCNERWGACVFFNYGFSQSICSSEGLLGHMIVFFLSFLRNLHTVSIVVYQFTLQPTVQEAALCSTPAPAFVVCRLFDDGHSDWCEAILHHSFDLHFSNNERCWAFFYVFISYLYVCFLKFLIAMKEEL